MSAVPEMTSVRVEPAAGSLGAYVHGFDIGADLDQEQKNYVRALMRQYHVVCFRGQSITPQQHRTFTVTVFGDFYIQPVVGGLEGYPEIIEVIGARKLTENWHQDSSHAVRPPRFSILVARELPPYGNDTQFANQHLAFERLSPGLQKVLQGLRAVHTTAKVPPSKDYAVYRTIDEQATHPVVRTHPETGRKALYVNSMYTRRFEDMTVEESLPLLQYLWAHCGRVELTFRHRWQPGDVVIWDNASVQHAVIGDMPEGTRRYMQRTTTMDDVPV